MNLRELAVQIRSAYNFLKENPAYKDYNIIWNQHIGAGIYELFVINDGGFRAIVLGDTRNASDARGYMYLFYSNDNSVKFPSVAEITRRLQVVARGEILEAENVSYYDWPEYGSLEKQRVYFAEILNRKYSE